MRPLTPPEKPYTAKEILDRVEQHFIVEGNPRCERDGWCQYNGTGCAVGCLLTIEDANKLATINKGISEYEHLPWYLDPDNNTRLLSSLQNLHDSYVLATTPLSFKDYFSGGLEALRYQFLGESN